MGQKGCVAATLEKVALCTGQVFGKELSCRDRHDGIPGSVHDQSRLLDSGKV